MTKKKTTKKKHNGVFVRLHSLMDDVKRYQTELGNELGYNPNITDTIRSIVSKFLKAKYP